MRRNKFSNVKVIYQGFQFDSLGEKRRYMELKILEELEEIKDLELQKKFTLQKGFKHNKEIVRAINYIADFYYYDRTLKTYVIEDFKGETDVFKIKKKILLKYINDNNLNAIFLITNK